MEIIRDDDYIWLNLVSEFIEDFVAPSSRARFYYLISKPSRRREVIHDLCYESHFDPRFLHPIPKSEQSASEIYAQLKRLSAPDRAFIFEGGGENKAEIDLAEALQTHVGFCKGIILYCPKQKLGYWEEHHCNRWILSRTAATPPKSR